MGKKISGKIFNKDPCENNNAFLPDENLAQINIELPIFSVTITLHENGFKLFSEKMGFRIIFFNDIKKISFLVTVVLFKNRWKHHG